MSPTARAVLLSALVSVVVTAGILSIFREEYVATPTRNTQRETYAGEDPQERAVIAAVREAEPAVVSVIISKDLPVLEQYFEEIPGPFGFQIPRVRQNGTERRDVGGGTAFFVSDNGLLMTNKHVVSDEEADYTVLLNDGRRLDAKVIARDPLTDIALLRVEGSGFPALSLAPSDNLVLGQTAIAIGNALAEFRNTVSTGVVSGLQRSITAGSTREGTERLSRIIQTDAAINAGNSGGPLLNSRGEVIGMNTAVAVGAQNIGFAIPVQDLRRALKSFADNGRIVRPYIGVRYVPVTQELREEADVRIDHDYGVVVLPGDEGEPAVIDGSPAAKAGLREGDLILKVDGEAITLERPLADFIAAHLPGERITLTVDRGGNVLDMEVTLEEWRE